MYRTLCCGNCVVCRDYYTDLVTVVLLVPILTFYEVNKKFVIYL